MINHKKIEQPLSLVERRAFLKLPMEERRKILDRQAREILKEYEKDSDRKDLQGGDVAVILQEGIFYV